MFRRSVSMLLAMVMILGMIPITAAAEEAPASYQMEAPVVRPTLRVPTAESAPQVEAARPKADEPDLPDGLIGEPDSDHMYFDHINMSAAGAAQVNDWTSGEYGSVMAEGGGMGHGDFIGSKGRLMLRSMSLSNWGYEDDDIEYFFPTTGEESIHELTLYGRMDLDPEDISLTGVTVIGDIEKHVYGDAAEDEYGEIDGRMWWYTAKVSVPAEDGELDISVNGELFATLPLTHVRNQTRTPLFSTFAVYDYVENETRPEYINSLTIQVSGFALPGDPKEYNLTWRKYDRDTNEETYYFAPASSITAPDELGYRYLTFDFDTVYYVDTENEVIRRQDCNLDELSGAVGTDLMWCDLNMGKVDLNAAPSTDEWGGVVIGDGNACFFGKSDNLEEDDEGFYFKDEYTSGNYVTLPIPYYCIYKELPPAPSVKPTVDVDDYLPEWEMIVTHDDTVNVTLQPGGYKNGMFRVIMSDNTVVDWTTASGNMEIPISMIDWEGNPGDYGEYDFTIQFYKKDVRGASRMYSVYYNNGIPSAITQGTVIDKETGEEAPMSGDAYLLKGSEDKYYQFRANPPDEWGLENYYPQTQVILCEFYNSDGILFTREMEGWNMDERYWYLDVKRADILEADGVRIYNSGTTTGFTQPGDALDIPLMNQEASILRALQAPAIESVLSADPEGNTFHGIRIGSDLTAIFEASASDPWSHSVEMEYVDVDGCSQIVPLAEETVGRRSFRVTFTVPSDADVLTALRCTLTNGESGESDTLTFDLSDYRVLAEMTFINFPSRFIGTTFRFFNYGYGEDRIEKSVVLTEDNIACVSVGDLPQGIYGWEITGKSGHIFGREPSGAVVTPFSYQRGAETDMNAYLADITFGSLTVNTVGFTGANGEEINPPARIDVTIQTPDLTWHTFSAATGTELEEIPVGSRVQLSFQYDAAASEEISGISPASIAEFNLTGDTVKTVTYQPFEWRTVSGTVQHPAGGPRYLAQHATVVLTQTVTRGGQQEIYTKTVNVDQNGQFSIRCYDHIPAKLSLRSYYFGNSSLTVTDESDVNIGSHILSSTEDTEIRVDFTTRTLASVNRRGNYVKLVRSVFGSYYGDDSVEVSTDSALLTVTKLSTLIGGEWQTYGPEDGAFDTYILNGQLYVRVHPEYKGTNMSLTFQNTVTIGGVTYSIANNNGRQFPAYSDGQNGYAVYAKGTVSGGEIRASVVKSAADLQKYTGFLVHVKKAGTAVNHYLPYDTCDFVYGKGLLRLTYDTPEDYATVFSFACRDADVQDMAAMLGSNVSAFMEAATKMNVFAMPMMTGTVNDFGSLRSTIMLKGGACIDLDTDGYLPNMVPSYILGSEVLPAYSFTYSLSQGNTVDNVTVTGTLRKRLADDIDSDLIHSLNLTFFNGEDNAGIQNLTVNGEQTYGTWYNRDEKNYTEIHFTAVVPLTDDNRVNFTVNLSLSNRGHFSYAKKQNIHAEDYVAIFALSGPDEVYIGDQLIAQGLEGKKPELQAGWKLKLAMRAFAIPGDDAANVISIWDNGVKVSEERVSYSLNSQLDSTGRFTAGACRPISVPLADNLNAGIHVIQASRVIGGEIIYTEPVVLTLMEGISESGIYVSDLTWTHWNSRIGGGQPDVMYFRNLSDMAGYTVWIWPSKKSMMRFKIHGACAEELENVCVAYHTQEAHSAMTVNSGAVTWWTPVTLRAACKCVASDPNSKTSWWEFTKYEYLGYIDSFEFEFTYVPPQLGNVKTKTEDERRQAELELYYAANGLGDVPDDAAQVESLASATPAQIGEALSENAELLPDYLQNLNMTTKQNNAGGYVLELASPTDQVKSYTISATAGEEVMVWDLWDQMDRERELMAEYEETGTRPAELQGWDVYWGEFDGVQGSTLIRVANKRYQDSQGLWHDEIRRSVYLSAAVAEAIEKGQTLVEVNASRELQKNNLNAMARAGEINANPGTLYDYGDPPDHWTKKGYDFSTNAVTVTDIAQDVYVAAVKDAEFTITKSKELAKQAGEDAKFMPKSTGTVMNIIGVADTAYSLYKGPSGADPNGLRMLLSHIKDDKVRNSLSRQINDYESMRESIFIQDMQMKGISTTSGFVPGAGAIMKTIVFIGGIGNGIISDQAKDFNRQVYNSTLVDIQRELKMQKYREERAQADKEFKAMVLRRFGKDVANDPRRLKEEMKYWHLERDEWGDLKWKLNKKVPQFNTYQDPSGFVFEAVEDQRVEGVTATLYYSDTEDGNYTVWTDTNQDETLRQANPQSSSDEGRYGWMVPTGWWKVRYEAEGYQTTETKPMPVPPVHTQVNIGLLSTEAPQIAVTVEENEARVIFTKYMQLESLIHLFGGESYESETFDASAFAVQFVDQYGDPVTGTVTFPDRQKNTGYVDGQYNRDVILSEYFVRSAVFTPDKPGTAVSYILADGMVSYAGVALDTTQVPELYTVTLNPNGGTLSVSSTITDEQGHPRSLPAPSREGYTFAGWFTKSEGGREVTLDSVMTADTEIFAQWSVLGGYRIEGTTDSDAEPTRLTVTFSNDTEETDDLQYVVAVYSDGGKLLHVEMGTAKKGRGSVTLTFSRYPDAAIVKSFLLDGDHLPVCEEFYYRIP